MTTLIDWVVVGAGVKSHASMLGTFFVYTLTLSMPIFNEILGIFSKNLREDFFLKIGILSVKVYTKKALNIEACDFTPAPTTTQSIKVVIVVAYYYYV